MPIRPAGARVASEPGGERRWERELDVSHWLRQRLRESLRADGHDVSFVIPDGLVAELRHESAALEILDGALGVVLRHQPTSDRVLLEVALSAAPADGHVAVRLTRQGGASLPDELEHDAAALTRRARRIGGDVVLGDVCDGSVTAVVTLATR